MKSLVTKLATGIFLLLIASPVLAQTGVGKLSGKIIDADTKEALIGANIVILNTGLGAATDLEGNYYILNITPGTYSVKASYVGFAPKTITEVRIVGNITYELNIELTTDFSLPEIVVEDKKFFEEKATNTVRVVDSEEIARLPVRGVGNIVSLQAGTVVAEGNGGQDGNPSVNIRGGRGSEVLYIVDGIPQNNLYNRGNVSQVSNAAIEQISFQVGGFEAKYGQSQAGIVSVTTKSGQPYYSVLVDVLTSTYTDDYGYNLYSGTISGPIIPGIPEHTIFLSGERKWLKDANPPAVPFNFPSIDFQSDFTPNNPADSWLFSGKTNSRFGSFNVILSGLYNNRTAKSFSTTTTTDIRKLKNDSRFFDEFYEENLSIGARVTQTVSTNTFWNFQVGYRDFNFERYNPFFRDQDHVTNLFNTGDSLVNATTLGVTLLGDGRRTTDTDEFGVYRPYGYSTNLYQRRGDEEITADFDITSQIKNNLLEFGVGVSKHTVRGYGIYTYLLAGQQEQLSTNVKFMNLQPFVYGYDYTGSQKTNSDWAAVDPELADAGSDPSMSEFLRPREPIIAYAYLQDRFELEDLVLNIGLRLDYYDLKSYELIDPSLPYAGGSNPDAFDRGDFQIKSAEVELSPRIGIGFPVTESTVFHAQYGRFVQPPELNDMYFGPFDYNSYITMSPQFGQNGALIREETTQYEIGFRQAFGNTSAVNITLFYKNIKGLINDQSNQYQRVDNGEIINAIYSVNTDFGTNKGLSLSVDVTRLSYFNLSLQYTFAIAEGTGSSTSSSQTAVFRNTDNLAPKVIAPLDFDQRHTGVFIVDFYVPQGQGGFFEMFNVNTVLVFNSGRPYTPTDKWDVIGDNGLGASNIGYVNNSYGPGSFRVDMKISKSFPVSNFFIEPYVWIENLLGSENAHGVWRSTGDPYTTDWLNTPEGQATALNNFNATGSNGYVQDYQSIEIDPRNFGIPRIIRLGLKLNFARF